MSRPFDRARFGQYYVRRRISVINQSGENKKVLFQRFEMCGYPHKDGEVSNIPPEGTEKFFLGRKKSRILSAPLFFHIFAAVSFIFKVPCPYLTVAYLFPSIIHLCQSLSVGDQKRIKETLSALDRLHIIKNEQLGVVRNEGACACALACPSRVSEL